jgi:energy-coupling factor transporter ATP-binding protein EcfA2
VKNPDCTYAEAYESCFKEKAKNNDDIIRNYINKYSKVLIFHDDGRLSVTEENPQNVFIDMDRNNRKAFFDNFNQNVNAQQIKLKDSLYRPFITAIKSKPFLLLAGISGTGKSRIVRELARACWDEDSEEYKAQKPRNFEMVQVKPNWHDSSELIGYVSRIDGVRYVVGPFLRFMVKAIQDPEMPYFLCLDEMNLAPVEQYFAEYLSVVESRKRQADGTITTDPIVDYSNTEEYKSLIDQLFPDDDNLRSSYLTEDGGKRLSIPNNLIIVGTVNMDETTFSFSRKVLDRAMTIEMNEVNLKGGLSNRYEPIGKLGMDELVGTAIEGVDVYNQYQSVCDDVIAYLQSINDRLEGTPFKVAYRTRNEALIYVVNNLSYTKDEDGEDINQEYVIARALDEITNMKILSRIEGDETKVTKEFLKGLEEVIKKGLESVFDGLFAKEKSDETYKSISLAKLDEMKERLTSGYTSFWS